MSPVSVSSHTLVLNSDSSIITVETVITNGSSVSDARAVTDSVIGSWSFNSYNPLGLSVSVPAHAGNEPMTGRSIIFELFTLVMSGPRLASAVIHIIANVLEILINNRHWLNHRFRFG